MVRIMLLCAAGMSTSLLVKKMEKAAAARNLEATIEAHAATSFESMLGQFDVILLGPQVRYKLSVFSPAAADAGLPLEVINPVDYGTVNGEKVLDQALKLIAARK